MHPLIFEQFHAILLVEIDELNLMVLLLDIIIVTYGRIITKFDLVTLNNNVTLSIVMLLLICLICTGSQIHGFLSEFHRFH